MVLRRETRPIASGLRVPTSRSCVRISGPGGVAATLSLLADLDDAVQEVFLTCFKTGGALDRLDPARPFRPFFCGVVRNVARQRETRRARRKEQHPSSGFEAEIEADEDGLSTVFDRAWALACSSRPWPVTPPLGCFRPLGRGWGTSGVGPVYSHFGREPLGPNLDRAVLGHGSWLFPGRVAVRQVRMDVREAHG